METEKKVKFLDISLIHQSKKIEFDIYRKPTTANDLVNQSPCHLLKQKLMIIKYHITQMNTWPIYNSNKQTGKNRLGTILRNNNCPSILINTLSGKPQIIPHVTHSQIKKLGNFTRNGAETIKVTNLFKNPEIEITCKTSNILWIHLKPHSTKNDIYERRGIYELSCHSCCKKHMGQTGRFFNTRYRNTHTRNKTTNDASKYAQHILDTEHRHVRRLNVLDKLHTYIESQNKASNLTTHLPSTLSPSSIP